MRSLIKRLWSIITSVQVLSVFLSFALMVFLSYYFMSDIEHKHLLNKVDNAFQDTQDQIIKELHEPQTTFAIVSETIRTMIMAGSSYEVIEEYIKYITHYMINNSNLMSITTGIYALFEVYGERFCDGLGWIPPDDYDPKSRPWYTAAVTAGGSIAVTEPSIDAYSGEVIITFARRIYNDAGIPLGVISLDLMLDKIRDYAVNSHVTEGSYGILFDKQFNVLAHPQDDFIGRHLSQMNDGHSILEKLLNGETISELKVRDYKQENAVAFLQKLNNGWYLGIIAYTDNYYQSIREIRSILIILGSIFALSLSIILLYIVAARKKAEERAKLLIQNINEATQREQMNMIAEMRRAEIAEESNKAKSDFLAKMSHEIRTPMNAIMGITEIQLKDNTLSLSTKEALERIYNSGDLLLGIINDILDLSKIEAGKIELNMTQYDISSLIFDTIKLNIMRYESKPIGFKLEVNEDIPSLIIGDELRIKQILNNLLSNAFKYTSNGMIELKFSVEMNENRSHCVLIFRVSDTGQGMTEEQIKKLGEKFGRFNMDANRKTEGTGLGMNITYNLIHMMNGSIHVESTPGLGTVFTIHIPQVCANPQPIGKELADNLMKLNLKNTNKMRNAQIIQEYMPYGNVLVIDDVETNLYVARGMIAPYGVAIDTGLSGFDAIDRIRKGESFDIIFMDHMMPRMDGIEVVNKIRSLGYTKPIVALTANAIAGQAEMFLKNGFDDFISKPIDVRQLDIILNKYIRSKQPPEILDEARKQKNMLYASGEHNIAIEPQLAEFFVRDALKTLSVLTSIYENNYRRGSDISNFIINIHALKSALSNVGESELALESSKLEQAGRDQNINLIRAALPDFIESLRAVIDKLQPSQENIIDDESWILEGNNEFLMEKMAIIQTGCETYNKKTAKTALAELKQRSWPRLIREQLSDIAKHLLHSEFEEAAGIARQMTDVKENQC